MPHAASAGRTGRCGARDRLVPMGRTWRARLAAGTVLIAGTWCAACSGDERTKVQVDRFETDLLDRWKVIGQRPERRAHLVSLSPSGEHLAQGGFLPALEMAPPAEVEIEVPELAPQSRLSLAAGVHFESYVGEPRTVHFEAALDGGVVFETDVVVSGAVPSAERRWVPATFPLRGGETLTLRTRIEPDDGTALRAGFGRLEIHARAEAWRTPAEPARPNVVLIVVDTLRADRLGCYGHSRPTSPRLDALARRGTLFARAYAPSPWTIPSTAALFTGLEPPEQPLYQQDGFWLDGEVLTLAEVFQQAGFGTGGFTSNRLVSRHSNFGQGFETYRAFVGDRLEQVFPQVEAWVRANADWRFFLYLQPFEPHRPLEPDPDMAELMGVVEPTADERRAARRAMRRLEAGADYDRAALDRYFELRKRMYDAEVASVDRQIGRVLDLLEQLGLADRTVVAVTSDHGEEFFEHGMSGHRKQLYDESVQVPLILAGPGVPEGQRVAGPVENRFLAHTLIELAGLRPSSNLSGANLLSDEPRDGPIFFSTEIGWWFDGGERRMLRQAPLYGVQVGDERLMWFRGGERHDHATFEALFDLAQDPGARADLSASKPQRRAQLRRAIEAWLERCSERVGGREDVSDHTERLLRELGYVGD